MIKDTGYPLFVKLIFWLIGIGLLSKLGFTPFINYISYFIGKIIGNILFIFKNMFNKFYKKCSHPD